MSILKAILDYARHLFMLTQTVEQTRRDMHELRQELDRVTRVVERLAGELRSSLREQEHQREKLVLKLENELLRHRQNEPPRKDKR